jgi:hypothetical protein
MARLMRGILPPSTGAAFGAWGVLDTSETRRYARPMLRRVRRWTRGLLGVRRDSTYYLLCADAPRAGLRVLLNNIESRFTTGRVETVRLAPKAHTEVRLEPERNGARLRRVELKALFRMASYVVGRRAGGELVLFDHLFTYFK